MSTNRGAMKEASLAALSGQRNKRTESLDDMAAAMFGDIKRGDSLRISAQPINIYMIAPDATQPRRALPTEVRRHWDGDPTSLPALFMEWVRAAREYGSLVARILDGVEGERPEPVPAHVAALLEIADLAASIRRDGLTNPITVVRNGDAHTIETGERRWLAYHLLVAHTGDDNWTRIPARVVEQFNRWRQAAENNTRQDLNAIGKARQLAVLLMELLQELHSFEPLSAFEHEQGFYAQVADGKTFNTPRGKGELLLNAMGLKNAVQLRQYRALLRLPREVWEQADDENWAEQHIRAFMQSGGVTIVTVSQDSQFGISNPPPLSGSKKRKTFTRLMPDELWQDTKELRDVAPGWRNYEKPIRDSVESRLRKLKEWVDEQLDESEGQGDD